jgi:hypothetical protein
MTSQSALSRQYVPFYVLPSAVVPLVNPTGDTVQFAFTLNGADPVTWYTGSWASTTALINGAYIALCLVGPGGAVTLNRGTWSCWIKITDDPEVPVIAAGQLAIT